MTEPELHPDVLGTMAGVLGVDAPLGGCNSCQRALFYGALAHLGAAGAAISELDVFTASDYIQSATQILLVAARADFTGADIPDDLDEDEWRDAFMAFLGARIEHYVDKDTGRVRTDPHDEYSDPAGDTE